jgi:hypothetical protein
MIMTIVWPSDEIPNGSPLPRTTDGSAETPGTNAVEQEPVTTNSWLPPSSNNEVMPAVRDPTQDATHHRNPSQSSRIDSTAATTVHSPKSADVDAPTAKVGPDIPASRTLDEHSVSQDTVIPNSPQNTTAHKDPDVSLGIIGGAETRAFQAEATDANAAIAGGNTSGTLPLSSGKQFPLGLDPRFLIALSALHQPTRMVEQRDPSASVNVAQELPRLEMSIGCFNHEQFKPSTPPTRKNPHRPGHQIADPPPGRPLHVIEILLKDQSALEFKTPRIRSIDHALSSSPAEASFSQCPPERVRVRSTFLLKLLHKVTGMSLHHGGSKVSVNERTSLVFLYPFKFFVTYADKIRAETVRLRSLFTTKLSEDQDVQSKLGGNDTPTVDTAGGAPKNSTAATSITPDANDAGFESPQALRLLEILQELFDLHLRSVFDLRAALREGTVETISFDDLWLLYSIGELAYQREPQRDHPPSLVRITQVNGGRQLLNNGEFKTADPLRNASLVYGVNSKEKENRLYIRYYTLDFDGEHYGPVENAMTIPPWKGLRNIHDLKIFPIQFCRPGREFNSETFQTLEAFKSHVFARGRKFVGLKTIDHKHYNGQVVGTQNESVSAPHCVCRGNG